ncbi:hypothetical protein [Stutzerimonas kunmingensis]|uniref:hypothetical protein n=1 Tax=Stutzerimonas kunmingensis TaxID=1211807 RepID=UPI0028AB02BF|nr:hypothetical protein [Stutzerimonas kunmingensis]
MTQAKRLKQRITCRLIFLLHLPRIAAANPSSTALEKAFARALEKASTRKSGESNYDPASDIRGCFLAGTVTDRLKSLPQYRIKLLTAGEVRQADYLKLGAQIAIVTAPVLAQQAHQYNECAA